MARVSTQTSPKTVTTVRVAAPLDLKHESTCVFPSFIYTQYGTLHNSHI